MKTEKLLIVKQTYMKMNRVKERYGFFCLFCILLIAADLCLCASSAASYVQVD